MELAIPVALQRVERYLVLLISEANAPEFWRLGTGITPELEWLEAVRLPNSDQRILSIGSIGSMGSIG
jgi:hypothetical protein